ncbi:threonine aldolase family protein [Ornithinimicrobium cavernae]|uniref:threonine aldolase family protein n=1 Tax=Ornithinimicrobium cavernae TaxID=2666047 RepID=UPI000D68E1D5|nr:threonine aldolase family protein [Ornithinimicrobium cavernae]
MSAATGVTADLRSDTLTRPTEAMRRAMAGAPVGDDVYGEDPTVLALQREVAELLGHEDALFTPTGSMANQLGVRLHVGPGQELVTDDLAHVLRAEMGAAAVLSGISARSYRAEAGLLDVEAAMALAVTDGGAYQVGTSCVVVENTHNFGGGTVQPIEAMRELRDRAGARGMAVHLDGARLWNAHVATGVPLAEYAACADTVSVCLSKGLGAPVGSLLVGSAERMQEARVWRKRFGGGMRQVGILAAAGRHALEHQLERLAEDHDRCQRVARAVAAAVPDVVDPGSVHTNILILHVAPAGWTAAAFIAAAGERGVLGYATGPEHVRFVWHLDVDDAQTDHAAAVLTELLTSREPARG